ncbi:unnamed protein product, partial [Amoebophrya sp. A25]
RAAVEASRYCAALLNPFPLFSEPQVELTTGSPEGGRATPADSHQAQKHPSRDLLSPKEAFAIAKDAVQKLLRGPLSVELPTLYTDDLRALL